MFGSGTGSRSKIGSWKDDQASTCTDCQRHNLLLDQSAAMGCSVRKSWVGESSIMRRRRRPFLLSLVVALLVIHSGVAKPASAFLTSKLYLYTCPDLEEIVQSGVQNAYYNDPRIVASLVRLHFHDCIVDGCDGSILLKDTPTFAGEQSAAPNANSARGFNVVDDIKAAVEAACPETVSCADILTLASRDSVVLAGGPHWEVLLGRYDSYSASQADANSDIPAPFDNFNTLSTKFGAVGLSLADLVVLSGAHTFGKARCSSVDFPGNSRLYNWSENSDLTSGTEAPDPHMDAGFLSDLQAACPQGGNGAVLNNLDISTPITFDNDYYQNLVAQKGLLNSDQALWYQSTFSQLLVKTYAYNQFAWFNDFIISITKMGSIGLKDASNGEIRTQCGYPNA